MGEWTRWSFETHAIALPGRAGDRWLVEAWAEKLRPPGLYLWGSTGTGKTGLAVAVIRRRLERWTGGVYWLDVHGDPRAQAAYDTGEIRRQPARAAPWFEQWSALQARFRKEAFHGSSVSEEELIKELEGTPEVVAIDDVFVGRMTEWKEEVLLKILNRVDPLSRPLMLTGNIAPGSIAATAGKRIADRIQDREFFEVAEFLGPSARRRAG